MASQPTAKVLFGLNAASAWFGFGMSFIIEALNLVVSSTPHVPSQFGGHPLGVAGAFPRIVDLLCYFTIWSQIVVGIVMTVLWRNPDANAKWLRVLRLDSVLMITVTGIVYHLLVAPTSPAEGLNIISSFFEHTLTPILTVLIFFVAGPRGWFNWRMIGLGLLLPVSYVFFTLGRGLLINQYPYDFFDVVQYGYASVLTTVVGILLVSLLMLMAYFGIDYALSRRVREAPEAA